MQPDDFECMTLSVDRGVAIIDLVKAARRNAWGARSALEYRWALHWSHVRDDVRVVVVHGDRDFCVGADPGLLDDISRSGGYALDRVPLPDFPEGTPDQFRRNHCYPWTISTPVIAAICGGCAGAGFVLASYADIRFADVDARIATAFAGLGLPAEYGVGWVLPRIVGVANAAQLLYSPTAISGRRAADLGWVQHVTAPGQVRADAVDYARRLARASSAQSLRLMKRQLFLDSTLGFDAAYTRSVQDMNAAVGTPDFARGVRALKSKAAPDFLS